jgi:Tol biopolymer transport system component
MVGVAVVPAACGDFRFCIVSNYRCSLAFVMLKKTIAVLPMTMLVAHLAWGEQAPQRWTPAAIASSGYESSPTFTADGREMFFLSADADFSNYRLMRSRCEAGDWSKPEPPPFARPLPVIEADPFMTHDGTRLYYISSRQDPKHEDFDIWYVDRLADATWGEPQRLPEPVNSKGSELLPRQDLHGRLYFGSDRPGGQGKGDIYVAVPNANGAWQVSNVGPPVNTAAFEYEAEVSGDGTLMVVVADRTNRSHLYMYKLQSGRWVDAGAIAAKDDQFQVGPLLSPKGDRLLFAQKDGVRSGEMFVLNLSADADEVWPPQCR